MSVSSIAVIVCVERDVLDKFGKKASTGRAPVGREIELQEV